MFYYLDMAGTHASSKKTAFVSPTRRNAGQTTNFDLLRDKKVVSMNTEMKRDKANNSSKFQTRNFKHINSSWTPVVHKPSNEQVISKLL